MAAATRGGEPGGIRVATLHPQAAGRVYAAYGGVYVSMALLWLWAVDSVRPSMTDWLGVGLAISGAFLVLGGFDVLGGAPTWVDLIALLSGLFFALNNLVFRAAQAVPVGSKITAMFYGCFILAAVLLAGAVEPMPTYVSTDAWLALALYAIFWLLAANIGSQWSVTHMEAGRSSIIMIMELITAVISAALIAGETMSSVEMLGGALILTAAFIEALRTKDDDAPVADATI
jgi:drug/metabolite transporter (DMT)-like permease